MATEFQYSQDIYLIYNCILTRHNRGRHIGCYGRSWAMCSFRQSHSALSIAPLLLLSGHCPSKKSSCRWPGRCHHLESVPGTVQPWPSTWSGCTVNRTCRSNLRPRKVWTATERQRNGNGTAANDGTPVHSSKVSLNRRCKIWARPSSGEWQMYVFRHRTIPSALQHFFPTPLRNMSQLCQCVYLPMRSFDLFKCT